MKRAYLLVGMLLLGGCWGRGVKAQPPKIEPSWGRVLNGDRVGRMMAEYHQHRAEQKVRALREKYPADNFAGSQETIRTALMATYRMPPTPDKPKVEFLRKVEVDGVSIEQQLLQTRPGIYSPALVYLPTDSAERHPALLMLPGHGDPGWAAGVQMRCLSFAKQGFLVMQVEPLGQGERGENALWNEDHDTQAMAFLLVTGQSMLGVIMADHISELTYLLSRADVNPDQVGVTGVSMGGTHTLWLSAIEPRIKAAVSVAGAPLYQPNISYHHQGLCDLIVGAYNVVDMDMIQALSAPRPLLHIYPGTEPPLDTEGTRLLLEGRITQEAAVKQYALDEGQIADIHKYESTVYRKQNTKRNYADKIIPGPHDYTQPMREEAAGWFQHYLLGKNSLDPLPEGKLDPLDRKRAIPVLNFWPDGKRPADFLTPTAYVQREMKTLLKQLPAPPTDKESWQQTRKDLIKQIGQLLGVSLDVGNVKAKEVGKFQIEGAKGKKLVVKPEPGIEVAMLLLEPENKANADGRLVVLLNAGGVAKTAESEERRNLTRAGAWTLCVDLRGMGESRHDREQGGYLGLRDYDVSVSALKLGETLAGYWVKDLLVAITSAKAVIGQDVQVTVKGEHEMGLVALLAAGQSDLIQAVEASELLASYFSAQGYGLPFAYSDETGNRAVRSRPLGGYGSLVPCIPDMLLYADITQLAALIAPRPLTLTNPIWASGNSLTPSELSSNFSWTRSLYRLTDAEDKFQVTGK